MTTLLIDGDVFAYVASAAVERAINWGEGEDPDSCMWTLHSDAAEAADACDVSLARLHDTFDTDRMIIALSDKDNWRMDVLPTYKGNRKAVRKPLVLAPTRQHIRDNYEVWERPGLEGDDVLGILMTANRLLPGEKVCVTIDKDLKTIPGLHYNNQKPKQGVFEVDEPTADWWHMLQTIMGDNTDGYTGCPGMGQTRAEEFLKEPYLLVPEEYTVKRGKDVGQAKTKWVKKPGTTLWEGIVSLYAKAGFNEEYALQQARVARILRASDYDFKKKEPILWTPAK